MTLVLLFIGGIIIIAAVRNSYAALGTALYQDVPAYVVWAAALVGVGALGFIPRIEPVSRALIMLVLVVLILSNYQNIIAGFQNAWKNPPPVSQGPSGSGALPGGMGNTVADVLQTFTGASGATSDIFSSGLGFGS